MRLEIKGLRGPAPRGYNGDDARSRTVAFVQAACNYGAPEHAAMGIRGMTDRPRNALCERLFVADKT